MDKTPLEHIEALAKSYEEALRNQPLSKINEEQRVTINNLYQERHDKLVEFFGDDRFLLKSELQEYAANDNFMMLTHLMEYIRAHGLFYCDYTPPDGDLFTYLLQLAFYLIESESVSTKESIMQYMELLYDTIFHQVRFDKFPDECYTLYLKLTTRIRERYPDMQLLL